MVKYSADDADEMLPPPPELAEQVQVMIDLNGADGQRLAARAQELANQIVDWWREVSEMDAAAAAAKSTEYGGSGAAIDLVWLGEQLNDMRQGSVGADWINGNRVPTRVAIELGIFFYLLGKIARWKAAILEDRPVSDDTIKDIHTYAMMARYNREHGSWP